jgi:hypothetical protein
MTFFFFGFLGGVIRGFVGIIKYTQSYKDVKLNLPYFSIVVFVSGSIGFISSWIVNDLGILMPGIETIPLSFALIVGYAGGDFIENIFKIIIKDNSVFQIGKLLKK